MSGTVRVDAGPDAQRAEGDRLAKILEQLTELDRADLVERHTRTMWTDEPINLTRAREQYRPAKHDLPGFGERYDGTEGRIPCGFELPHICECCGDAVEIGRTCKRSTCPRCAAAWVLKRAPGLVNRLWSAAKMREGTQYKHHVVASPPKDLLVDADDPEQACRDTLKEFCSAIDAEGLILYHPWSGDNDGDSFGDAHEDDRGAWKHRLFEGRNWEGDVRDELKHRPHWHMILVAPYFPGGDVTDRIHERTGWVFHRITERNGSPVSLGDMESVARAVCYSLSHVGIDTTGERNQYVRSKLGSAFHSADDRHLRDAKKAVHKVAPDVLGIPSAEIECRTELEDVDDADESLDLDELPEDSDDDPHESSTTTTNLRPCGGELVNVDDAEFVEKEDWQQTAKFAEQAVDVRERWKDVGGWQQWDGQAILDTPPPP